MVKVMAAYRLLADSEDSDNDEWFNKLSDKQKREYIELHPTSKYADDARDAEDEQSDDDGGDSQRLEDIRRQHNYLVDDIKDMESKDEDASHERSKLAELKEEIDELEAKAKGPQTAAERLLADVEEASGEFQVAGEEE